MQGIAAIVGPLTALVALIFAWRTGYIQLLLRALSALCSVRPAAAPAAQQQGGDGGKASGGSGLQQQRATRRWWRRGGGEPDNAARAEAHDCGEVTVTLSNAAPKKAPAASEPPGSPGIPALLHASSQGALQVAAVAAADQARTLLAGLLSLATNPLAAERDVVDETQLPVRVAGWNDAPSAPTSASASPLLPALPAAPPAPASPAAPAWAQAASSGAAPCMPAPASAAAALQERLRQVQAQRQRVQEQLRQQRLARGEQC